MKRKCIEILNDIFGAGCWNIDDLYSVWSNRYEYDSEEYFIAFEKHSEDVCYELFYNGECIETGKWN